MKTLFLAFFALLSGCTAAPQTGVTFPPLPVWRQVSGTITAQQVGAEVAKLAPGALLLTSDATFTVLDYDLSLIHI